MDIGLAHAKLQAALLTVVVDPQRTGFWRVKMRKKPFSGSCCEDTQNIVVFLRKKKKNPTPLRFWPMLLQTDVSYSVDLSTEDI